MFAIGPRYLELIDAYVYFKLYFSIVVLVFLTGIFQQCSAFSPRPDLFYPSKSVIMSFLKQYFKSFFQGYMIYIICILCKTGIGVGMASGGRIKKKKAQAKKLRKGEREN